MLPLLLVFWDAPMDNCGAMRHSRSSLSLIFSVLFGLGAMLLAPATSVRGQEVVVSRDPNVVKAQLRQGSQLARKTIREIQALSPDDSGALDARLLQDIHQTYALLRAANLGLEGWREGQTYKDPMLQLAAKRVDEAWNLARNPWTYRDGDRAFFINTSVRDLSRVVRLVDQALMILPP